MKTLILFISITLFFTEWCIIRKTSIKSFIPILVVLLISLPIGLFYALHLVAFPIIFILLAWVFCFIEDEIKEYFKRRELTEEERSLLKDL